MIIANKCASENREVTVKMGLELAKRLDVMYFETSAKDNINVAEAFEAAVDIIHDRKNLEKLQQIQQNDQPEKAVLNAIAKKIDQGLIAEDPAFRVRFFGSSMTNSNDVKIKVHANIKKIHKLCTNTTMSAKDACDKIRKIIDDKELIGKDSGWAKFVKWVKSLFAGLSKDKRGKLDTVYESYRDMLPKAPVSL